MNRCGGHEAGLRTFRPRRCCYTDPGGLQSHFGNIEAVSPISWTINILHIPSHHTPECFVEVSQPRHGGGKRLKFLPPGTVARMDATFQPWKRNDHSEPDCTLPLVPA